MQVTQNSKLKTQNCIDWHCHILPGLDDGARSPDESVAMATVLRDAGYSTVYCTPHLIKGCYEASNREVREAVAALQARLDTLGIPLRLLPGREYYLDEFLAEHLQDPLPLGDTRFLLIEIPNHILPDFAREGCYRICRNGYTPMIAHPERCRLLDPVPPNTQERSIWGSLFNSKLKTQNSKLEEASLLGYLKDLGCAFQGNLGSFSGRYGERVRQAAGRLREAGGYTHFGSDAHGVEHIRDL